MNDGELWGTSVLGLAAATLALGAEYVRADKSDPRRVEFFFKHPKDVTGLDERFGLYKFDFHSVEAEWINKTLHVNAFRYFDALQTLKSVIHSR